MVSWREHSQAIFPKSTGIAPRWLTDSASVTPRLSKIKILGLLVLVIAILEIIVSSTAGPDHLNRISQTVQGSLSSATSFLQGPPKTLDSIGTDQPCSLISQEQMNQLQKLDHLTAYAYHEGYPVSENSRLKPGSSICILIAVPQKPIDLYKDGPVPTKGPDNIHLFVNSSDVRISMSPPIPVDEQPGLTEIYHAQTIVYFKELELRDQGIYQVNVDLEWTNWQWANQWTDDYDSKITHYATGLDVPFSDDATRQKEISVFHDANIQTMPRDRSFPQYIYVVGSESQATMEQNRQNKPMCSDRIMANKGRWYFANAHKVQPGLVDEWGYAWDGDQCRLDFFTEQDEMECLADRRIHAFGDSNLRRLSKAVMSGGRTCRNLTDKCQGEDTYAPILKLMGNSDNSILSEEIEQKYNKWTMSDHEFRQFDFGYNTSLYFGFQRAVTVNYQDWTKRFYDLSMLPEEQARFGINPDERFLPTFQPGIDLRNGARARMPPGAPEPDLVIIGFGAWDEAYAPTFEDFERTLPHYRDALMEAYPDTPMVLRISHGHCCPRTYNLYRHNSGTRIQHINDITRKVFQVNAEGTQAMNGKIVVIDAEGLVGRPEDNMDYGEVLSNHIRFSKIRTEMQMMLNAICERDTRTGRARLRKRAVPSQWATGIGTYPPRVGGGANLTSN